MRVIYRNKLTFRKKFMQVYCHKFSIRPPVTFQKLCNEGYALILNILPQFETNNVGISHVKMHYTKANVDMDSNNSHRVHEETTN